MKCAAWWWATFSFLLLLSFLLLQEGRGVEAFDTDPTAIRSNERNHDSQDRKVTTHTTRTATSPTRTKERSDGNIHHYGRSSGYGVTADDKNEHQTTGTHHHYYYGGGTTERTNYGPRPSPPSRNSHLDTTGEMYPYTRHSGATTTECHHGAECYRNNNGGHYYYDEIDATADSSSTHQSKVEWLDRHSSTGKATVRENSPPKNASDQPSSLEERTEAEEEEAAVQAEAEAYPNGLISTLDGKQAKGRSMDLDAREEDPTVTITAAALMIAFAVLVFTVLCVADIVQKRRQEAAADSIRSIYQYLHEFDSDDIDIQLSAAGGFHVSYLNELAKGINTAKQPDQEPNTTGLYTQKEDTITTDDKEASSAVAMGRAILCFVTFLYGTLNVSLRLIYQLDSPPTAAALSTTRGWLASVCFVPLLLWNPITSSPAQDSKDVEEAGTISTTASNNDDDDDGIIQKPMSSASSLWMAGIELGLWNFLAQGLVNVGLLSVGSARASFLTQASVIMTPLLSIVAGQSVSKSVWVGCALTLGGLTLLSAGGGDASSAMTLAFSAGDILILTGAFSWSLYLFRLSMIAPKFDEVNLQAIKTTVLAVFCTIWLGFSLYQDPDGTTWGWATNGIVWLALVYSAVAPGTVADIMQQQGQKEVSATEANIILSLEPVFAALCAWLLLGETMSTLESIGGGLILAAALVATR